MAGTCDQGEETWSWTKSWEFLGQLHKTNCFKIVHHWVSNVNETISDWCLEAKNRQKTMHSGLHMHFCKFVPLRNNLVTELRLSSVIKQPVRCETSPFDSFMWSFRQPQVWSMTGVNPFPRRGGISFT